MQVYHDYTLIRGTSEGDATSDDGRQAWFCLVTDQETPAHWRLGISEFPDTDILGEIVSGTFKEFYREGHFNSPQTELDIMKFIEAYLEEYFQQR
jgi:hypothetical protein